MRNSYDDDGCYRCDACGAVEDFRYAPEAVEPELERKPIAIETQAILRQAASIRRIRAASPSPIAPAGTGTNEA